MSQTALNLIKRFKKANICYNIIITVSELHSASLIIVYSKPSLYTNAYNDAFYKT